MTILRRICGVLLLFIAVAAALAVALLGFAGAAALISSIPVLAVFGLMGAGSAGFLLSWPALRLLGARRARLAAAALATVLTLAVAGLATVTIFSPMPEPANASIPAGVSFWDLPTGSRIAYAHTASTGTPRPYPVIFLHGGPGTPGDGVVPAAGNALATEGFNVYTYDQVGAGRSTRLADVTQYTVARQVADLEAIRTAIGADKLILIGQSWGGSLAAQYLAAFPDRVARVAFTSPGAIWGGAYPDGASGDPWARLTPEQKERFDALSSSPRMLAAAVLLGINPNAARALLPDAEADQRLHEMAIIGKDSGGCPGAAPARVHHNRQGFYVNQLTTMDFQSIPDPRPKLQTVGVPALIMRGECDYVKWSATYEYRTTLSNSTLVYIKGAGHSIAAAQPETYLALLRAFLKEQPLPLPAYTSANPPS